MKSKSLVILLTLISLLPTASISQAARVIDGTLGTWIAQQASPRLSEILTQHPRFQGERIRIMATEDGHPVPIRDQLTDQIREQLIDDLLSIADVQIVFDDTNRCKPIRVDTILGIEVQEHKSREHRISLAMVDIEEGIWLNGTNVFWHGRLTDDQRRAFNTRLAKRPSTNLFNTSQIAEIAQALHSQMQCNNRIATPIFFEPAVDDPGRKVLRKLIEKISNQALTTLDKEAAVSIIRLEHTPREFSLGLTRRDLPAAVHRVAAVSLIATPAMKGYTSGASHKVAPSLLSDIQLDERLSRGSVCDVRKDNCADISFEFYQSAYPVIFYTANGQVAPLSCEAPIRQKAGRLHYGLNVPDGNSPTRPSVGFYALAFSDKSDAKAVHQAILEMAPKCGGRQQGNENWAASLQGLMSGQNSRFQWRAIHLTRDHSHINQL